MPIFDDDFDAIDAMFSEAFGGIVSICRGALTTTGIDAEAVSRDYEAIDKEGFITIVNTRDYIIDVDDYRIASVIVDPRAGDRIKESIDDIMHVFETLPVAGRPVREWVGNQRPQWVIHTKLIGTE